MITRLLLSAAVLSGVPLPLSAATSTWKGGTAGSPDTWNTAANWLPAGVPASGNDIVFPAGATFIGAVKNINPMVGSVAVQAPGYTFQPTASLLSGFGLSGGVNVSFAATGSAIFNTAMNLTASQTFTAGGSRVTVQWNNYTLLNGHNLIYAGSGIHEVNGGIFNPGNVLKTGTGRLALNSLVAGGGEVSVQGGTLECGHDTMEKNVSLSAPATLIGTGRMAALVTAGGTVQPGSGGPGTLHITGAMLLNSTATVVIEFAGNAPGQTSLITAGDVTLNNALLNFTAGSGFLPFIGMGRTIIDNEGGFPVTGTFAGLPEGTEFAVGNITWRITYTGGDGNDVKLTPIAAAPTGITRVWQGYSGPQWSSPGSWLDGIVPKPGDSVLIPPLDSFGSQPECNFADGYPLHRITFTGGGIELSGGAPHLSDGIVQQAPVNAAANLVSCGLHSSPLAPAHIVRVHLQSGGPLTVMGGPGFGLPHVTDRLELVNDQPFALTLLQPVGSGAGSIRKLGTGPAMLTTANAHSGGVRVMEGTLELHHSNAAGSGTVLVESAGKLSLDTPGPGSVNVANHLRLIGKLQTTPGAGAQIYSGSIECSGSPAVISAAGGNLTLSGAITGLGSFKFTGLNDIILGGIAPGLWSGGTLIEDASVVCSKDTAGVLAIPGNITVTGGDGYLSCLKANSVSASAFITVADSALVKFWQPHTIGGLVLSGGEATTGGAGALTITGNVTVQAGTEISALTGNIFTGPAPVTWNVADGLVDPDFIFGGSLNHAGGTSADVTKLGSGQLRVNAAGGTWTDASLTIFAGAVEWNDEPAAPGVFGPDVTLAGGNLSGAGRVRSLTATGGTFSPGDGSGTFTCDSLTMNAAATFLADAADQLVVEGPVSLSSTPLVIASHSVGYGTPWTLIDHRSTLAVAGNFAGMPEGHTFTHSAAILSLTYMANDRNDIAFTRSEPPAPDITDLELSKAATGTGPFSASGTGLPGFTYQLEHSTDLQQWLGVKTGTAAPDGSFTLEWLPPTGPRCFFRVRGL